MLPSWTLAFRAETQPSLEVVLAALGRALGAPVTAQRAPWEGNPRDGYVRAVSCASNSDDLLVSVRLGHEDTRVPPEVEFADFSSLFISLDTARPQTIAPRASCWSALAAALTPIGYVDATFAEGGARLVDAYDAHGDLASARSLRARSATEQTARLVALPPHWPVVIGG